MKIKVESSLQNNASIWLKSKFGTYTLEQDLVNGKHHYTSTFSNGIYAFWYTKADNWILGLSSGRGENGGYLHVNGASYSCPNGPLDWKYLRSSGDWPVAKGVKISCECKYRKVASSRPVYYSILNSFGQRQPKNP